MNINCTNKGVINMRLQIASIIVLLICKFPVGSAVPCGKLFYKEDVLRFHQTYTIDPNYISSLQLYQPLTIASNFMPDRPNWIHNMQHTTNLLYDPNGIFYSGSEYTTLRPETTGYFRFQIAFFMELYVNPHWDAAAPTTQLIFAKRKPGTVFNKNPISRSTILP